MAQKNKVLKQQSVAVTVESTASTQLTELNNQKTENKGGPKQMDYESMELKIQTSLA